jgi:uncharacterized protein involved in exopolysaccharide biosynthesis
MNSSPSDPSVVAARLARMESAVYGTAPEEDKIDLQDLLRTLWQGRWLILTVTVLSAVVALVVSVRLPNQYKATAVFMPAYSSGASSLSRLAGEFGGLASLAGLSLGGQNESERKVTAAIELVKSWGFQEQFIRDNKLEVAVFAARGWDRSSNQLLIDPSLYDTGRAQWVRSFNPAKGQSAEPSGWELYEKMMKRITISQDKKTDLVTLSVEFYSPLMAKRWADLLVAAVNKHIQEQDRIEAEKSIKYLEEKIAQTSLVEIKTVLSRLIEEQTKNLMLARVSDEYVLRTLSPAKVPEKKSKPQRAIICAVSTLVGAFLATMGWLLWSMYRRTMQSWSAASA